MNKDTIEADLNKHFSRYDDPLFDEEESFDRKKCLHIKRTYVKVKDEHTWKFIDSEIKNKDLYLSLSSKGMTKKLILALLTPEGFNLLLKLYKEGNTTTVKIKKALEAELK